MKASRVLSLALLSLALLTAGLVAAPATAQAAPLTCEQVGGALNLFGELIRVQLDSRVAGSEYKISKRKSLVIHGVEYVGPGDGPCQVVVVANVTLKRKLRADAHGTVTGKAHVTVDAVGVTTYDLFFDDIRVADVSLSNTLEIGEAIYRWVANKAIPDAESVRIGF
jgi:hypothetical protein